jgi:hypothetical protein
MRAARKEIEVERQKVRAEANAFQEFKQLCAELPTSQPVESIHEGPIQVLDREGAVAGQTRIHKLYRTTIMDVDHYQKEYSGHIGNSIRAELGQECATLLSQTSVTTDQLKECTLSAAEIAIKKRERFIDILNTEDEQLESTVQFLDKVRPLPRINNPTSFDQLQQIRADLTSHEAEIDRRLDERQKYIHRNWFNQEHLANGDLPYLNDYLFASLQTQYPVLNSLTELLEDIQNIRKELVLCTVGY